MMIIIIIGKVSIEHDSDDYVIVAAQEWYTYKL